MIFGAFYLFPLGGEKKQGVLKVKNFFPKNFGGAKVFLLGVLFFFNFFI